MTMTLPKPPKLSPEEKKMPLAKYYDTPLSPPDPIRQILIDAGPIDPSEAIKAENFADLMMPPGVYGKKEFGYCMMPDGSGYYALYERSDPRVTGPMKGWYMRWINFHSKSMVPGQGCLRYKLWMPLDHIDHSYVNGKDRADGINTLETLDMGAGSRPIASVRHPLNPSDLSITQKQLEDYKALGCSVSFAWESFEIPGSHFCMSVTRPCPLGGMETLSREWIGWRPVNGKLERDAETPVDEQYLKNVVIHNTIEHFHLPKFLPQLYEEYKDQPLDAD